MKRHRPDGKHRWRLRIETKPNQLAGSPPLPHRVRNILVVVVATATMLTTSSGLAWAGTVVPGAPWLYVDSGYFSSSVYLSHDKTVEISQVLDTSSDEPAAKTRIGNALACIKVTKNPYAVALCSGISSVVIAHVKSVFKKAALDPNSCVRFRSWMIVPDWIQWDDGPVVSHNRKSCQVNAAQAPAPVPVPAAPRAPAAAPAASGGTPRPYVIKGFGGKCLDVQGPSTADGTPVQMWDCNGATEMKWQVMGEEIHGYGGKCLDVRGPSTANGTPVQMWDCNGATEMKWQVIGTEIRGFGGKCLDVRGPSTADGTVAQMWDCNDATEELWSLQRA